MTLDALLKTKRYPGRFMAIGKDGDAFVAVYGATGRSPSSLARRFVQSGDGIYMGAIDDTVSKEGNVELLEYPAVKFFTNGLIVANGRHIQNVTELQSRDARQQLSFALTEEAYEPDEYRTPRITGCIVKVGDQMEAALHIVRSADDGIDHAGWTVPLESGTAQFISTYRGEDVKPTPSFSGDPTPCELNFGDAQKAAKALFEALSPKSDQTDYRVGVVAIYFTGNGTPEIAIVNRQ